MIAAPRVSIVAIAVFTWSCSSEPTPPQEKPLPRPERTCGAEVSSDSADAIVGDFTGWAEVELKDGKYAVEADPGDYGYSFVAGGVREEPPASALTKWVDGVEHRLVTVPDCDVPTWGAVEVTYPSVDPLEIRFAAQFVSAAGGSPLDATSIVATIGGKDAGIQADPESGLVIVSAAVEPGKNTLRISASDVNGKAAESDLWLPHWTSADGPADWVWQDGLMYFAMVDRFRDTDGSGADVPADVAEIASYRGGDFEGVRQAVREGYFEELGVDVLWLTPFYENPDGGYLGRDEVSLFTGYHGYWPVDPTHAEERFGGDEALAALIEEAHRRGIRVVFDVVLNHVHEDHVYCDEHPDWCAETCVCGTPGCEWEGPEGRPLDCQFAPYLVDLDYRDHAILQRVVADLMEVARRFDVDGLRIDAAKHMDHVIMKSVRASFDRLEAQGAAPFYLVGETFTADRGLLMQYVSDHELHGQFDFPLMYAIRGAFGHGQGFGGLEGAAADGQRSYGAHYEWMSPFMGNHDVARVATDFAGNAAGPFGGTPDLLAEGPVDEITQWDLINRLSMAFAFLLTQPGVPLIYYGDEVGLAGAEDPDNRRFMPEALSANQVELRRRVRELGQLRRSIVALRRGDRQQLWLDDDFYVYVRDAGAPELAFVAMNKSDSARTESVTIPIALGLADATLTTLDGGREVNVIDGSIRLSLDPWEYVVLVPAR